MSNGIDYERGRREAELEGRVSHLEIRFGTQERAISNLSNSIDKLESQVGTLNTSIEARSQVDKALQNAAEQVSKRGVNRREFWFALLALLVTFGLFVATLLAVVHG